MIANSRNPNSRDRELFRLYDDRINSVRERDDDGNSIRLFYLPDTIRVLFCDYELASDFVVQDVQADILFIVENGKPIVDRIEIIGVDISGLTIRVEHDQYIYPDEYDQLIDDEDDNYNGEGIILWADSSMAWCLLPDGTKLLIRFPNYPDLIRGQTYTLPVAVISHNIITAIADPVLQVSTAQ
jgi:hypothetical protein